MKVSIVKLIFVFLSIVVNTAYCAEDRDYFVGRVLSIYNEKRDVELKCKDNIQICEIIAQTGCMAKALVTFRETSDKPANQAGKKKLKNSQFHYELGHHCEQIFDLNRSYFIGIEKGSVFFNKQLCNIENSAGNIESNKLFLPYDSEVQELLFQIMQGKNLDTFLLDLNNENRRFRCHNHLNDYDIQNGFYQDEILTKSISRDNLSPSDTNNWVWKKAIDAQALLNVLNK